MTMINRGRLGRRSAVRTIASAAVALALGVTGLAFGTSAAMAAGENGTISVENADSVLSESVITVNGEGFAQRPNGYLSYKLMKGEDNTGKQLDWPADAEDKVDLGQQPEGAERGAHGSIQYSKQEFMPDKDGKYSIKLKLPKLDPGKYNITLLGGNDGLPPVSTFAPFTVVTEKPAPTEPTLSLGATSVAADTSAADADPSATVSVEVKGAALPAGAELAGEVNGVPVTWAPKGREKTPNNKVAEDGTFSGKAVIAKADLPPASYSLNVTVTGVEKAFSLPFSTLLGFKIDGARAANSSMDLTVVNLPKGASITAVGVKGTNWLKAPVDTGDKQFAEIKEIQIPADAAVNEPIELTYSADGKFFTENTGGIVTPNNDPVDESSVNVTLSDDLTKDANFPKEIKNYSFYQSALNPETNKLFVTSAVGRPPVNDSALLEFDGDTLKLEKSAVAPLADKEDPSKGRVAVYGIGLDNVRGLVWVTNTRQDTVSVYKQDDLSLVKQFDSKKPGHNRDIIVDESTGIAYSSLSGSTAIRSFDLTTGETNDIQLATDSQDFDTVMSLAFDSATGHLYTASLSNSVAASIDVRSPEKTVTYFNLGDKAKGASGVAFDAHRGHLFIASQQTNNVVVVDVKTGDIIADVKTGAGALNVAYDPTYDAAYVSNRAGGTVTVLDGETLKIRANLSGFPYANHVSVASNGIAYAVDKGKPGQIHKLVPTWDKKVWSSADDGKNGEQPSVDDGKNGEQPSADVHKISAEDKGNKKPANVNEQGGDLAKTGVASSALALGFLAAAGGASLIIAKRRNTK